MRYFKTPFGHVCYALAVTNKHLKRIRKDTGIKKKNLCKLDTAYAHTSTFERAEDTLCIVVLDKTEFSYEEMLGLIAHEAVHIWQNVVEAMEDDKPSDEFEAYSIQMICTDLFGEYRKYINGRDTTAL